VGVITPFKVSASMHDPPDAETMLSEILRTVDELATIVPEVVTEQIPVLEIWLPVNEFPEIVSMLEYLPVYVAVFVTVVKAKL
jgi:hypothetical protein